MLGEHLSVHASQPERISMTEARTGNRNPDSGTTVPGHGDDEHETASRSTKREGRPPEALGGADGAS